MTMYVSLHKCVLGCFAGHGRTGAPSARGLDPYRDAAKRGADTSLKTNHPNFTYRKFKDFIHRPEKPAKKSASKKERTKTRQSNATVL
jgi:hypothetical protein